MKHVSTLALIELLTEVVNELDWRGIEDARRSGMQGNEGVTNQGGTITTVWGDLRYESHTWQFVWNSEAAAEMAARDRGIYRVVRDDYLPA